MIVDIINPMNDVKFRNVTFEQKFFEIEIHMVREVHHKRSLMLRDMQFLVEHPIKLGALVGVMSYDKMFQIFLFLSMNKFPKK